MSIGSFVSSALTLLGQSKYDVVLSLTSSAVDATAKKCFQRKNATM